MKFSSIGTPRMKFEKAIPHNKEGIKLPPKIAQSQNFLHLTDETLLRNSKPTPRTIKAINKKKNAT